MRAFASSANRPKKRRKRASGKPLKKFLWPIVIICGVALIDQITKVLALSYLDFHRPVRVLGDFFMLTLVYKQGGALATRLGPSTYYMVASIFNHLFVLYYIYVNRFRPIIAYPLAFIAGGAVGNITDRLVRGSVVDFLDFDFFDINLFGYHLERWWTFNIADSSISLALVFLFVVVFFIKPNDQDTGRTVAPPPEL